MLREGAPTASVRPLATRHSQLATPSALLPLAGQAVFTAIFRTGTSAFGTVTVSTPWA